jgi:hypothetical protein
VSVHEYARGAGGVSDREAVAGVRQLRPVLAAAQGLVDSPVFTALPSLTAQRIPDAPDAAGDEQVTATAERISLAADLKRPDDLAALLSSLSELSLPAQAEAALREQAGLALLDLQRPNQALAVLGPLAEADTAFDRPLLQQRHALALMQATGTDDERAARLREAEARLARLDRLNPGSGETLGLLGSIAKRMYEASLLGGRDTAEDRDRALHWYEAGFASEPTNYYPGINAIAMLRLRARATGTEADAERARALVPVVRFMLDRPAVPDSVWRRATAAELLLHEHLLDGAPGTDAYARAYRSAAAGAMPFEIDSMRKQLRLFKLSGDPSDVIDDALAALPDAEEV